MNKTHETCIIFIIIIIFFFPSLLHHHSASGSGVSLVLMTADDAQTQFPAPIYMLWAGRDTQSSSLKTPRSLSPFPSQSLHASHL